MDESGWSFTNLCDTFRNQVPSLVRWCSHPQRLALSILELRAGVFVAEGAALSGPFWGVDQGFANSVAFPKAETAVAGQTTNQCSLRRVNCLVVSKFATFSQHVRKVFGVAIKLPMAFEHGLSSLTMIGLVAATF